MYTEECLQDNTRVEKIHTGPGPEMTIKCELNLFIAAKTLGHEHSNPALQLGWTSLVHNVHHRILVL